MYEACKSGDTEIIQMLASHGVSLDHRFHGRSFLEAAVESKSVRTLLFLLKNGGDPNTITQSTEPLLHRAAHWNDHESLELLLDYGAKINLVGPSGLTALHYAAEAANQDVVQRLLERGADSTVKDYRGETALVKTARHIRRKSGAKSPYLHRRMASCHKRIIRLLVSQGSKRRHAIRHAIRHVELDMMAEILMGKDPALGNPQSALVPWGGSFGVTDRAQMGIEIADTALEAQSAWPTEKVRPHAIDLEQEVYPRQLSDELDAEDGEDVWEIPAMRLLQNG